MTPRPVAFVSGSGRNIGYAIALELLRSGFNVCFNGRSLEMDLTEANSFAHSVGGKVKYLAGNVCIPDDIDRMFRELEDCFGGLDVLINNASYRRETPFEEMSLEEWRDILHPQLDALFLSCKAALPMLKRSRRGRIVNIGGMSGHTGAAHRAHVVTFKAAVTGFSKALSSEFGSTSLTVNTVVPGAIDTKRSGAIPAHFSKIGTRPGKPEEVAFIVAQLCDERASYVNGQTIHVNGGAYV